MSVHKYFLPPATPSGKPRARWRVNYDLPPHPDGRRRRGTRKGFTTERKAREKDLELRGQIAAGEIPYGAAKETLANYLRAWLAGIGGKATTRAGYRDMCEWYIIPALGGLPLEQLTAEQVDALYRRLEQDGGRRKQGLSPKTVRNVHIVLHRALEVAVERGHVRRNVASLAHPPSTKSTKSRNAERVWTVAQLQTWLAHIRDDRLYGVWYLAMTTGMRRGELAGLHWADVDLEQGALRVRWELTVVDNAPVWVDGAKSEAGERTVDLDQGTVAALRAHHARQAGERMICGADYQMTCPCPQRHEPKDGIPLVVCWQDGTVMHPDRLLRALYRHAKALGLPRIDVHGLRHSYATIALEDGEDPKLVAERLGHDVRVLLTTYDHVTRARHREAAERVARRITG